jgi:hypothetical protein
MFWAENPNGDSMIRLKIICEGQTEESFIKEVLTLYLKQFHIEVVAIILPTSIRERTYRGGIGPYSRVKKDILRSFEKDGAYVTTMFDLYKLHHSFPGKDKSEKISDMYERVRMIEEALRADINNRFFIPYIQLHEFEALLFSDIYTVDEILTPSSRSKIRELETIIQNHPNGPESINDGEETAPSKGLFSLYPTYKKRTRGIQIAIRIPLDIMRKQCPHFDAWLIKIEEIAGGEA